MNTTLKISFWQITLHLIVALPFACFGILGIASMITDGGLFMLLSPFGWFLFCLFYHLSLATFSSDAHHPNAKLDRNR